MSASLPLDRRRVSSYFGLHTTQPFLGFVDVDIDGDIPVFLDPTALLADRTPWAEGCVALVQDFFQYILWLLGSGQRELAQGLVAVLREPNETHLGFSKGIARGHGLGPTSAGWLCDALQDSKAIDTGLLEHLEDTILMVDGVGGDLVSDIATNLMREPLLAYTEEQCLSAGIPLVPDVDSGPLWDPWEHRWHNRFVRRPMVPAGPLLLVPKSLVRVRLEYDYEEYYRYYILPYLRETEIEQKTAIVRVLKSGPKVFNKDLEAKYGTGKKAVVDITKEHPELLGGYRIDKREQRRVRPAMSHEEVAEIGGGPRPDLGELLADVARVPTGNEHAAAYHEAVFRLVSVLFYPELANPVMEQHLHGDLKRIDVTFDNIATHGFFRWVTQTVAAPLIFLECKNYGGEIANPELDQLIGRFSPKRGKLGLIVCRSLRNPERFSARCQHTFDDDSGAILVLTDADLGTLVEAATSGGGGEHKFDLLRSRFRRLLLRADEPDSPGPPDRDRSGEISPKSPSPSSAPDPGAERLPR